MMDDQDTSQEAPPLPTKISDVRGHTDTGHAAAHAGGHHEDYRASERNDDDEDDIEENEEEESEEEEDESPTIAAALGLFTSAASAVYHKANSTTTSALVSGVTSSVTSSVAGVTSAAAAASGGGASRLGGMMDSVKKVGRSVGQKGISGSIMDMVESTVVSPPRAGNDDGRIALENDTHAENEDDDGMPIIADGCPRLVSDVF